MSKRITEQLLSNLFLELDVNEEKFYRLVGAMKRVDYIDHLSIRLSFGHSDGKVVLMAEYTGPDKIGNAIKGIREIDKEIVENIERLYLDISRRSGIQFARPVPCLYENQCVGYAKIMNNDEKKFPVVLNKE
jgi:hypothetical protein